MNSAEVRADLDRTLRLDLVGPEPGHAHEKEVLGEPPSRFYLCGFLVPLDAPEQQKFDPTSLDEVEGVADAGAGESGDDGGTADPPSARKSFFPSSIGLSVIVPKGVDSLSAWVAWGDYVLKAVPVEGSERFRREWHRQQRHEPVSLPLSHGTHDVDVPNSDGLRLTIVSQPVRRSAGLLDGTIPADSLSVAVFLVNERRAGEDDEKDAKWIFQAGLTLKCEAGFVARPSVRGHVTEERDEDIADVQYRGSFEFAVGHGIATHAQVEDGRCLSVSTSWIPMAQIEKVVPGQAKGVEFGMDALAAAPNGAALRDNLLPLVSAYRSWIEAQRKTANLSPRMRKTTDAMLADAKHVAARVESGIGLLSDPEVLFSFQLANRVMAASARKRGLTDPKWHPFQLAFILMNLRGISEPTNGERETVDLLFFPTGGGKTEAYLGLAAFTLILRRIRNPGVSSAGVSVLMRYTLRLLTLDQLSRAAALICALELEREKDSGRLGEWPFEIGLWVGKAATPNRMGRKDDGRDDTARAKTLAFQSKPDAAPSPIPLENCPWCGEKFSRNSFQLVPTDVPERLSIHCSSGRCEFNSKRAVPVVAVDEMLYRRAPCFVIATVDKLASLPFEGKSGVLFGLADRYEPNEGFFGACDPGRGTRLDKPLLPPDLIIQDELHLISGPLGTMVGLYETAVDQLCQRTVANKRVRPKVVASTATVRRASAQVCALFARPGVQIFPPPGPDRRDSFFAQTVSVEKANARMYLGVAAPGRSLKVVMLRTYLALLGRCGALYEENGGKRADNPVDPYMTLLGYFNALRELGGSRRIIEEEVKGRLPAYRSRKRLTEEHGPFGARELDHDVVELTSREPTHRVSEAKRRLAQPFSAKDALDVAIATNMISVGLDVQRLGLMVVLGQPRMTSEYIQATSRVGRDDKRPGLVVTLLNIHKPRDRSHYERFESYHDSFYRSVEVTSVTPFAPRAIDRGLPAIVATLARHGHESLTPAASAVEMAKLRTSVSNLGDIMAMRVVEHASMPKADEEALVQKLRGRTSDLLDSWTKLSIEQKDVAGSLSYQRWDEVGGRKTPGRYLLIDPLDPELETADSNRRKFKAQRSLRDVEPSVPLLVQAGDTLKGRKR
jgi:hypothetical protein